jgi:hypothetical protein
MSRTDEYSTMADKEVVAEKKEETKQEEVKKEEPVQLTVPAGESHTLIMTALMSQRSRRTSS